MEKIIVTNSNNNFYFAKSTTDEVGFIQITIAPVAQKNESLNNEIRRIDNDQGHFTETDYPFIMKPNFSTLGNIMEISRQGPLISFYLMIVKVIV